MAAISAAITNPFVILALRAQSTPHDREHNAVHWPQFLRLPSAVVPPGTALSAETFRFLWPRSQ